VTPDYVRDLGPEFSERTASGRRPVVSAPTATQSARRGIRLRLKPADRRYGSVQGAWWPRLGPIDRVIYDENSWAPVSLVAHTRP
jgi:hypothetical protein